VRNAREKPPVFSLVLRGQLPSTGRSWGSGGFREPIEIFGKFQDRPPCAGIGQLTSYLPRLFGTVEPLQAFIQNPHLVLPHIEK
jgi:hypothetical protein